MSTVAELKTEIETTAKAFWAGNAGVRETYYTKGAASFLSETDARAVMATGPFNVTAVDGTILKMTPKAPQRKADGIRGAQMNIWLYSGGQLYAKYNLHVDVLTLEKEYKRAIEIEEEDPEAWKTTDSDRTIKANKQAAATRKAKGWTPFASK